jgi:hypothetical protein
MSISQWILINALLAASTQLPAQTCLSGMPESLRSVVEQKQWTIVQPQDLSQTDLSLWNSYHPGQCPGVAAGRPSSKAKRYFIVALIHPDGPNSMLEEVLLVTQQKGRPVTQEALLRIVSTPHVIWLQDDPYPFDGASSRDSFVFERVSGRASQLIVQDNQIKSFQPLDSPQPALRPAASNEALIMPPMH